MYMCILYILIYMCVYVNEGMYYVCTVCIYTAVLCLSFISRGFSKTPGVLQCTVYMCILCTCMYVYMCMYDVHVWCYRLVQKVEDYCVYLLPYNYNYHSLMVRAYTYIPWAGQSPLI